ncbi:MAG: hypothetical protein DMG07_21150 [Acidobacteria bacterium]|nr:MAG: hypothetical protein DMG07_21150 [Acidobacteriota bacterium]
MNLLDPDPEKRNSNQKYVTEGLALAEEIGALTASFPPALGFGSSWLRVTVMAPSARMRSRSSNRTRSSPFSQSCPGPKFGLMLHESPARRGATWKG